MGSVEAMYCLNTTPYYINNIVLETTYLNVIHVGNVMKTKSRRDDIIVEDIDFSTPKPRRGDIIVVS